MAISRVGASQGSSASGVTSRALTRTPGATGNLLIASFLVVGSGTPTISDSAGNSWTVCNTLNQDATNGVSSISWWAVANGTSSTTVTVQSNVAAQFCSMFLEEFTGTHTTAPFDAMVNSADGASGTPVSPTITPVANDCLLWAACWDSITAVALFDGTTGTKGGDDGADDWTGHRVLTGRAGVGMTAAFTGSGAYTLQAATFKPAASGVTVALTGVAGTSARGLLGVAVAIALSGVSGTAAVGTVTPSTTVAVVGQAVAGSAGTLTPATAVSLSGVAATGSIGTATAEGGEVTAALTGVSATSAVGSVTPVLAVPVAGELATGSVGSVTPSTTVALVGASATGAVGTLSAGTVLSGVAATGAAGSLAPSTTLPLTGVDATAGVGSVTPSSSVAVSGEAATGHAGTVTPSTTVALTGVAAAGAVGSVIAPGDVTAALTGVSATSAVGAVVASATGGVTPPSTSGWSGSVAWQRPPRVPRPSAEVTVALTSASAVGQVGRLAAARAGALTGVVGWAHTGAVTPWRIRTWPGEDEWLLGLIDLDDLPAV